MPKLIDYPRTNYSGAWELSEIVDDTGGKCAIETAARKLNRKVSGSFKAIIGSAVKFGLLTSKRDLLTTTTLFKRIKHAYDKQEELLFHKEAFLTPPLFTQICRKFRMRELPVQMLDVMLIREFGVEEINAQGVAKAFVEGCRMVGLIDERNTIADIDAVTNRPVQRRELSNPRPNVNTFRENQPTTTADGDDSIEAGTKSLAEIAPPVPATENSLIRTASLPRAAQGAKAQAPDLVASLFGFVGEEPATEAEATTPTYNTSPDERTTRNTDIQPTPPNPGAPSHNAFPTAPGVGYQIQVSGPGVNTSLSITDEEDITIAIALLEKMRRQFKA